MYPHRIRLRGPWTCEPLERRPPSPEPPPAPFTMTLPCRWADGGLRDFAGRVRFRRRFGYPGRIDAHERVWLTVAGVGDRAAVALNGSALGTCAAEPCEWDVTALLRPRNELVVDAEMTAEGGGLWGEVALEVRCTAYLRGVRAWEEGGRLHVAGLVVGVADRPLDLYVLRDRRTVAYAATAAAPDGAPFHLTAERGEGEEGQAGASPAVQVDLVNGAVVWYTLVQAIVTPAGPSPAVG
jgi:hypothetical protein